VKGGAPLPEERASARRRGALPLGSFRLVTECQLASASKEHQLVNRFSLQLVVLTRGAAGAVLLSESGQRSDLPGQPTVVVDTVGAGDSFTATLVIGRLSGLSLATINAWGNRVAAFVSSQPGATPHLPDYLHQP
jgi:sugar/nucleoside kinase (ribokinase family)